MSIDRAEVERIARLARIELADADKERMTEQLSAILEYVRILDQLDLERCEPKMFAPAEAPLRDDELDDRCLGADRAIEAAPASEGQFFLVPPIVENVEP